MSTVDKRWNALDQIRALAAFLVFTWHFTHGYNGTPVSFAGAPLLPFAALFDEGHVGVALFMCLSGYLFARLLDGKRINYGAFFAARAIRLFPLLLFVFAIRAAQTFVAHQSLTSLAKVLAMGFVKPVWPNGGWSIAVELHFYLILPFLLGVQRKNPLALSIFVAVSILFRLGIFLESGKIQDFAYWTIVGRIDQFVLGICAFQYRALLANRNISAAISAMVLALTYYAFDRLGGFTDLDQKYEWIWVVLPTIEAISFSLLISWYDNTYSPTGYFSDFIAKIGFYSYGIYLMHFFFVFKMAKFINEHILPLDNFYVAWAVALPCFLLMIIPAWLVFHLIERPIQRFKPAYTRKSPALVTGKVPSN